MNKIALIGNGYWGSKIKKYIPEFFDLKYVVDSKFNKKIIWNDADVVGVIVATPIETHYKIIKEALEHGKNVFSEKPVTLYTKESLELKELAEKNNVVLGVDYTQTFSKSIQEIIRCIDMIGEIEYIEMSTKHLGRFMGFDVYWLLASHHLSILDMIIDLNKLNFIFKDHMYHDNLCTTGSILFDMGRIDVSTNFPGKEMLINIYGKNGSIKYRPEDGTSSITVYNKIHKLLPPDLITNETSLVFDEKNNLKYAVKYFKDLIFNKTNSNIDSAIKITKILEQKNQRRTQK